MPGEKGKTLRLLVYGIGKYKTFLTTENQLKVIAKRFSCFCLIIGVLILDQLTKYFICQNLGLNQSIPIIKNIFHLTYVRNTGAAFGILKGQTFLFTIVAVAAIVLIWTDLSRKKPQLTKLALSLILSGAIGNLIDRLRFSAVIDFLDFRIWPVFNISDSAITIGAILLAYNLLIQKSKCKN